MAETRHPKIEKWQKTKDNPPKMEHFATREEIEHEKSLISVFGLSVLVDISYTDPPGCIVHKAEAYMPFEGSLEWYMRSTGGAVREIREPKFWRER